MSDDAFEAIASVSGKARPIYEDISTHASEEDAITALHCVDSSEYKHLRAYGKPPRRVKEHGEHEGEVTHRKRSGIDMSLKPEVDSMLRGGAGRQRIRLLFVEKV
ncbi:hypothetical protein L917_17919 [Phytophthora nicotianae]|uniref:Uncharacterized protein n=1 Tax=Phytophthora nicotianae TaxID=4792 RepID=W2KBR3_PHYNI|nr:hypothetical protein L917_17919 [Phytophthora nicotianae]